MPKKATQPGGPRCPNCGRMASEIKDGRERDGYMYRRRTCLVCLATYTTAEFTIGDNMGWALATERQAGHRNSLIRHILDYLTQHGQGTTQQIAVGGAKLKRRENVANCLRLHPDLFEEVGEQDGKTVWGLSRTSPDS